MVNEKKILKILENQKKQLDRIEKLLTEKSESVSRSTESVKLTKTKSPKSITGFMTRFAEEGFFDTPKTLKEISEELARQGYHYRTTSLTSPIQNLLRKRSIGRIIVNGKWAYVKR